MLQKIQLLIEAHVPGVPGDAVYGTVRSAAYSFTISMIQTKGNYIAGAQSAALAAFATAIYALTVAFFNKLVSTGEWERAKTHGAFFVANVMTYIVTEFVGAKMAVSISVLYTGAPYALEYPGMKTPLFGLIPHGYDINLPSVRSIIPAQLANVVSTGTA